MSEEPKDFMNDENVTREFMRACGIGFLALLTGPPALITGILVLLGGVFPAPKAGLFEMAVGVPLCALGVLVSVLLIWGIVRAFQNQRPYRGWGLVSGILVPLLCFGVCTAVAFGEKAL